MSSIQKGLRSAVAAALVLVLCGLSHGTEAAAMYDTRATDRITQRTVRMPPEDRSQAPRETPRTTERTPPEPVRQTGIGSITPDDRAGVRAKKRQNRDVVGWLRVPGTNINDVVLQNPIQGNPHTKKNEYYLNRDFQKRPDSNGVFCADYRASFGSGSRQELSRITTIYGHSFDDDPDGDIFAQLKRFRNPDFAREHPYIFFSTASETTAWEVFAVFDTTIYLPYVRPNLSLDTFYQTLDMIHNLSLYSYDVAVDANDRILALSTCTFSVDGHPSLPDVNDYRFVVMARLVAPDELPRDEAAFAVNASPMPPDATFGMAHL